MITEVLPAKQIIDLVRLRDFLWSIGELGSPSLRHVLKRKVAHAHLARARTSIPV